MTEPRLCKDCAYYTRMPDPRGGHYDRCKRKPLEGFDVVNGPTKEYRDCRAYRTGYTGDRWPLPGNCGPDAQFWKPA